MQSTLQDSLAYPLSWFGVEGILVNVAAETYLNFDNYEALLIAEADSLGHNDNDSEFNAFINYIFFDAAAFNLADNQALNTALASGNTLAISDMETYAAAYTP